MHWFRIVHPGRAAAWWPVLWGAVLGASGGAAAQTQKLRPGLWEHTVNVQGGKMAAAMAEMQKSLASLPPEQRKQMEAMMAERGVGMGAKGNTVRICMTREDADLDSIPPQEGCTQSVQRLGANTIKVSFQCKGQAGEPPTTGEGTVTVSSPTAYTGQFKMRTTVDGQPEQMDMAQSGRWLSADCGAIKPAR